MRILFYFFLKKSGKGMRILFYIFFFKKKKENPMLRIKLVKRYERNMEIRDGKWDLSIDGFILKD